MRSSTLSCLAAGLLTLTLGGDALAASSGFTSRAGRFDAAGSSLEAAAQRLAREQLAVSPAITLGAASMITLASGQRVVKLPQFHQGLPVVDRGVAVTFGAAPIAHLVTASIEDDLPSSIVPAITAADAAAIAHTRTSLPTDPARAVLAIWPTADGARLAWGVEGLAMPGSPYLPVVVIDAQSGEILFHRNTIESLNQANVFPSNPVKSPSPAPVVLPVGDGKLKLENALVQSVTCVDQHSLVSIPGIPIKIHSCDLVPLAAPDANGDYLLPPASDTDPEDAFSEVSMFHHVNRAYDFFRAFDPALDVNAGAAIPTVSNLRLPDGFQTQDPAKLSDPNLPLVPFQNAFFAPSNPLFSAVFGINGGAMWFGQGPLKDYSYDGDVIYHEFTHAVVNVTLKLAGGSHMDAQGASAAPGAMNEGLADYFSSALTGDPDVGEYAVQDFDPSGKSIRSLSNPDACPAYLGGEVHQDATMFSGSLWDVRTTLTAAQQSDFDRAVYDAMNMSPTGNLGYEDFAKILVASLTASPLGQPVADALSAAFTARGLLPQCTRILKYDGKPLTGPKDLQGLWFAPGTQTNGVKTKAGYTPGVIAFHASMPAKTAKVTVAFKQVDIGGGGLGGGGTPFTPTVLVRFGADPIAFTYKPLATTADVLVLKAEKGTGGKMSAVADVPADLLDKDFEMHVMIGSSGQNDGAYTALSLTGEAAPDMGTGGAGGMSSTTTTTTAATTGTGGSAPVEIGGCGCAAPGADPSEGAGLAALAALGLVAARRRRRG